jgi:NAD(P)H-flavin reductase
VVDLLTLPTRRHVDPMLPRPFRVVDRRAETSDVWTIGFEPADALPCIRFEPAQLGMVGIPGVGEVPISFSNDATDPERVAMTIRAAGAITTKLVGLPVGSLVGLRGPFGVPWPLEELYGREVLIVAGGLGLAPLRSLVLEAVRERATLASLTLVYGARSPDDLLYRDEVAAWSELDGVRVLTTVDRPDPTWDGHIGVVTTRLDEAVRDPSRTAAFMCGPDIMLAAVSTSLTSMRTPAQQIWVTMERNMKCAIGLCGHCQFGPLFLCKDGPVFRYDRIARLFSVPEV